MCASTACAEILKSKNCISLAEQVLRVLREDTRAHADAMWLSVADKAAVVETLDHAGKTRLLPWDGRRSGARRRAGNG